MKKVILAALIVCTIFVFEMRKWAVQNGPLSESVLVVVPQGANSTVVATSLEKAGVIDKAWLFKIIGRLKGLDKKLQAGEYNFEPKIPMVKVMNKIANGEVYYRKITFPEGVTVKEFADILNNETALIGEASGGIREGMLLPETYNFTYGEDRQQVMRRAQKAMDKALQEAWENRAANLPLKSPEELLILASIIEKETGIASERPQVASVFVNRLRKGMKLQTDPTVIYALTAGKSELGRNLTRKDLGTDSPYNTYKYAGLPPAPICNPGLESIKAAANPDITEYLYFVASGNGGHNFAKSLNEHNENVKNWKKVRNNLAE